MAVKKLGHVGIFAQDFEKMRDFYSKTIGLTVTDETPPVAVCELAINAATMYCAICDLDNHLRNLIKHGDDSEDVKRLAVEIRNDYLSDIKTKLE